MNTELKARVIAFIGDLEDRNLSKEQATEATALYNLLTRGPGRQRREAAQLLAEAGPDGKELVS